MLILPLVQIVRADGSQADLGTLDPGDYKVLVSAVPLEAVLWTKELTFTVAGQDPTPEPEPEPQPQEPDPVPIEPEPEPDTELPAEPAPEPEKPAEPEPQPEPQPQGFRLSTTTIPREATVGSVLARFEGGALPGGTGAWRVYLEGGDGAADNGQFQINEKNELLLAKPLGSRAFLSIRTEVRDGKARLDKVFLLKVE